MSGGFYMIRTYDCSSISLHYFSPYVFVQKKAHNQVAIYHNITGDCILITGDANWLNELINALNQGCNMECLVELFKVNNKINLQEMIVRGFIE